MSSDIPYLSWESLRQLSEEQERQAIQMSHMMARMRFFSGELDDGGAGATHVAITTDVIPARVGVTPGGPVSVTIQEVDGSGNLVGTDTVDVYSWVRTDSANPQDEVDNKLYIYIAQDVAGVWWFIAQDCTQPPISQESYYLQADQVVTTTLAAVNDTRFTLPTYTGWFNYTLEAEISVVGIPGNQAWDIDIGIYDETAGEWIRSWDWAGAGDPLTNPRLNIAWTSNVDRPSHTIAMYAIRSTTTGTVTLLTGPNNNSTGHELTGPF